MNIKKEIKITRNATYVDNTNNYFPYYLKLKTMLDV